MFGAGEQTNTFKAEPTSMLMAQPFKMIVMTVTASAKSFSMMIVFAFESVDCDDFDEVNVGSIENDNDCDGVIATNENDEAVDCDDNDILLGDIDLDTDCDGIISHSTGIDDTK